jgi:hypothetical protein
MRSAGRVAERVRLSAAFVLILAQSHRAHRRLRPKDPVNSRLLPRHSFARHPSKSQSRIAVRNEVFDTVGKRLKLPNCSGLGRPSSNMFRDDLPRILAGNNVRVWLSSPRAGELHLCAETQFRFAAQLQRVFQTRVGNGALGGHPAACPERRSPRRRSMPRWHRPGARNGWRAAWPTVINMMAHREGSQAKLAAQLDISTQTRRSWTTRP